MKTPGHFSAAINKFARAKDDESLARLKTVIDYEGGKQLQTPRTVTKVLDSVRFMITALGNAPFDLADLVWLQLIKDGQPTLYRWIEDYSVEIATTAVGVGTVSESAAERALKTLIETVDEGYFQDLHYRNFFAEQLPGMQVDFSQDSSELFSLHEKVEREHRDAAIRKERLASPDHYRYYFAFSEPLHAIKQIDFDRFWASTEDDPAQTASILIELHRQTISDSMGKGDILLERLKGLPAETFSAQQAMTILKALAICMDEAYRERPFDRFGILSLWDRAERLVPALLGQCSDEERLSTIEAMFNGGEAIGWLTSLFRHDTFAQGRFGERSRASDEWLFTAAELDRINQIMLTRYRGMTIEDVLATPDAISLLFAWSQGGDEQGPRRLVGMATATDRGLIDILLQMSSPVISSSRGRYEVLKRVNLAPFLDFDAVKTRIEDLAAKSPNTEIKEDARIIREAFLSADRF